MTKTEQSDAADTIDSAAMQNENDVATEQNDDPTASLQADLDRFRDLALRSQADFD